MAGGDRHLHASRLHSAAASGQLRRLVLSVPRLAIRFVGPHPAGAGAAQSARSALSVRLRYQDPDRRNVFRPSIRFDYERTRSLSAAERLHEVDGAAPADRQPRLFVVHRLSDAAQFELLVDVRRHPDFHARRADRHRRRAGDALHAACRSRLQFRRRHHARRQLRLAVALYPRQRRFVLLPCRLRPYGARHVLRLL